MSTLTILREDAPSLSVVLASPSTIVAQPSTTVVDIAAPGPQGPPGPPGARYEHVQAAAASEWIVNHNLGMIVDVFVTDLAGSQIGCDTQQVTSNQVRVFFAAPTTGRVLIR